MPKAKPFIKWVGGKGQLIEQLDAQLPADFGNWENVTYVEPFGKYTNPQICDPTTIRKDSELLQRVEIMTGDFEDTFQHAHGNTLFYFDPPYRPLSDTSSFNDYTKEAFNDDAQIRLKEYCDRIHEAGYKFMLSNSDCHGKNEADNFFDVLYGAYDRARIYEQNGTPNIVCRNYKSN